MAIYQGNQKVANNYYIDNTVYCVPVGTIISYTSTIAPTGFLICDGSEVSKNTYSDLYKVVGDKFGTATDTTKFKLPDLRDKFVQGANDNVGTSKNAGLPNISGKVGYLKSANEGNYYQGINTSNGCFNQSTNVITSPPAATTQFNGGTDSEGATGLIRFNASDSNSIYGNSSTVQPPSVCLTYIIKATKLSDIPIETSGIIDDNSLGEDRTWSASKIRNSTIPYVLIDTTKDINFNDYVETGYYTPNKSFSTGWFTHSILNAPTNGWLPAGGFGLEVKTFDNTGNAKWFTQVLYSYVGTDNNSAPIYSRTFFYDGTKTMFSPWKRMADIDDTNVSENEVWSSKKVNDKFTLFPFKWKLIGTSSPETSDTSNNTFKQTMSKGTPFCVYHSSGIFCFGNGVPDNRGQLYGMTRGVVASVTYSKAGLLTVSVGNGKAYIYEMEVIV